MGLYWRRIAVVAVLTSGRSSTIRNFARGLMSNAGSESPGTCRVDNVSSENLIIHHFRDPVESTQDEARHLLLENKPSPNVPFLVAIADQQTSGRGTKGRTWEGGYKTGNLFATICIPLEMIPVMPTLLPLQVAVLVAEETERALSNCREGTLPEGLDEARVRVKWPNDVLINERKLAGILIESETVGATTWLMVGIGTNIAFAPGLEDSPGKSARAATCIQEHCPTTKMEDGKSVTGKDQSKTGAYDFGVNLAQRLVEWITNVSLSKTQREREVVEKWKSFAEFGKTYELRGNVEEENEGAYQGEEVVSVGIQYDGQLLVRGQNGRDRLLVADYLF